MPRPPSTLQHISLMAQSRSAILSILMCDFLFQFLGNSAILFKTSRHDDMKGILEQFNMKNVVKGPTRITNHSKTLIDLIVTNRKDLVKQKGTCPLGISDHDMIYATLSASIPRDQPKIITIRNFNKFNERNFQSDIARAPFQVCEVFDDPTDVYYAWNLLFTELCNEHAPLKQIKVCSNSLPWITKEIRITRNQKYNTLKRARQLNDPLLWDNYKRLRNKVSTMTNKAKADYYSNLFDEVKSAAAYWRLLKRHQKQQK